MHIDKICFIIYYYLVGGEGWQEKVHNKEAWKNLLRMARNRHILHMPMEWKNGSIIIFQYVLVASATIIRVLHKNANSTNKCLIKTTRHYS